MDNERWGAGDSGMDHRWAGSSSADKRRMSSASAPPPHMYERQHTQGRGVPYPGSDPRTDPHHQHHSQHAPQHPAGAYWGSSSVGAVGGGNRDARYSSSNSASGSVPPLGYRHRDFASPDRLGGVVEGHHDDRHLYDRESRGGMRVSYSVGEGGGRGGMSAHEDSRSIRGSGNGVSGSGSGAAVTAGGLTREQELEIANEMERELRRHGGGQHSGSAGGDGGGAGAGSSSGNGAGRDDTAVVPGRVGPVVGRAGGIDAVPGGGGGGSGSRSLSSSGPPSGSASGSAGGGDPGPMSSSLGSPPPPAREGSGAARSSMGDEVGDGSRRGSVDGGANAVGGGPGAGSSGGSQSGTRSLHPRSVVPRAMGPVGSDGRGGGGGLGPNGSSSGGPGYRSQDPGGESGTQQHQSYWRGQPSQPHSSASHHQQRRPSSPSSAAAVASASGGGYAGGAHALQQQQGQHYRQHGHGQPPERVGAGSSSSSGVGGTGGVFYPGPPRGSSGGSALGGVNGAPSSGSSSGGVGRVSHGDGLDGNWRVHGGIRGGDGSSSSGGGGGSQYPSPHGRDVGDSRRCPPPPPPPTGVPQPSIQYRDTTPSYPTYRSSAASAGSAVAVDDGSVGRPAVGSSPIASAAAASVSASVAPSVAVASSTAAAASPSSVSASHAPATAAAMPDQQRAVGQRLPPSAAAGMSSAIAQLPHPPPRVLPREVDLSGGPGTGPGPGPGPSPMRQGPGVAGPGSSWGSGGGGSRGGVGASAAGGTGSGPGTGPGMGAGVPGVSHQTPLERLGAGLDRSYRVIQTAVPLGTRKVALQTLDDLALFFVDMRSTLLVRMASAADVMDELCLRTETFEKALSSPGGIVICAPQFLRPRGAMEEAGMLDGDLITHINGDCVSADPPEQLVWNAKSVKGVRLLDITFLRATGESSTTGYPWHEALAWWQTGVRRHMMESAQPEQRQWMHEASEKRCHDAILSYRLFREYSMPSQRASMSSASGVPGGGSGGPPGNPPTGGVMMHSVGGARHPAGPEPRGNNSSSGTGTGSRTGSGAGTEAGSGAGAPGGVISSSRGSPAQSSVPSGGGMAATGDYGGVGRERDRERGMASLSSSQRSAGGGIGNGPGSGIGGIVTDRGGTSNGNGVGVGAERSGNGIARNSNGVGVGGGWSSRGSVPGSASVGAEGISGDRGALPSGASRRARGHWEDRDYWGGREFDMRARGRDYGRGRGMEFERDDWAYHQQQQRHWPDARAGPKVRSPLTVGGKGSTNSSRGGAYSASGMDIEERGGGESRDSFRGVIEGAGRGARLVSSPAEKDPGGKAGYERPSSPPTMKRGSPGSLASRVDEDRQGSSSIASAGAGAGAVGGDGRSGAVVGMSDRPDERERDTTGAARSRRRPGDDGSIGGAGGSGVGDSAGSGSNYFDLDGDDDGEKSGAWDRNRDSRYAVKGVVEETLRRKEMLLGPARNRDEKARDVGQGDGDGPDGARSSGPSASSVQQQHQQHRRESTVGEIVDDRRGDDREGYRNRRHEFDEEGEGRHALGPGRTGKRVFSSDSPDRVGGSRRDDERSKRSKLDRDGDRDSGNDYPASADGAGRRRLSGGDVEVVSPGYDRRNGSTSRGFHEKHQQQEQQREAGGGFSRGSIVVGARDSSEMMSSPSSRRWGTRGDRHRGSDDGEVEGVRKDDRGGKDDRWQSSSSSRIVMTSSREGPGGDGLVSSPSLGPSSSSTSGRRGSGVGGRSRSRSREGDCERRPAAVAERGSNAGGHQRRSGTGAGGVAVGERSASPAGALAGDGDGQGGTGGDCWGSMRQSCDYCAKKKIKCSGEANQCSRCRKDQIECIYSPKKKTGPIPRKASAAGNDHDDSPGRAPTPSSTELPRSRTRGRDDDTNETVAEEISENARGEEGGHGGAISRGVAKAFLEAHRRSSSRSPDSVRAWRDRRGLGSKNGSLYTGGRRWEDVSRGGGQTSGEKGSGGEREWSSRRGGDNGEMDEPSTVAPHLMTRGISPDSTHRIKHVAEEVPANGPRPRRDGNGIGDRKEQKFRGRGNSPEMDVDDNAGGGGGLRGNRARLKQSRSREESSGVRGDDDSDSINTKGASESSGSRKPSSGAERESVPGADDSVKESVSSSLSSPSANPDARGSPASSRKSGADAVRDGVSARGSDAPDSRDSKESRPTRGFGRSEGSEDRRSASARRSRSISRPIRDEEGAGGGGRGNQPEETDDNYPEDTDSNYSEEPERERRRRAGGKKGGGDGSNKKWTSGWEKPTGGGGGVDEEADAGVGDNQRLSPEEKLALAGFDVSTAPLPPTFLPQSSGPSQQQQQQRSVKESKRGDKGRSRISPMRASSAGTKSGRSSEDYGADKSRSSEGVDGGGATTSSSSRGGSAERRSKKRPVEIATGSGSGSASVSGGGFAVGSSKAERDLVGMDSGGSSADEVVGPRPSKRMGR